ncbi:hypothetical protein ACTQ1W_07545 [Segatella copri]|jgi:ABC-type nitrate/sulfonate/bicarbonate transport system permease component|uniref:hypothetical protein n=1 Tax=Segatella copri TaxID=165179 RepID=UPI0026703908|nr:hypothetical protein [uncultured Prevotella sp.]
MEWIFSGIGTSLVSAIIGLVIGGSVGYKVGLKTRIKQKQQAGDNSNQSQIGNIVVNGNK